jgi:glycosyltransferase involved in cell wall biosynthesis
LIGYYPAVKVAIVHDWLVTYAGAERVLEQMLRCLPHAELFSLVDFIPDGQRDFLLGKRATTTFIQNLPYARQHYRRYLPLMPLAIEQLDLSGFDLVISSSHAIAKGVLTSADQIHVCYCHSPIRYAWDLQHQYLKESGLDRGVRGWVTRAMLHQMRQWDLGTANGVDAFFANSEHTRRRIAKTYRRNCAAVIYPPVDIAAFTRRDDKEDFFLTASRCVPYKRIDLIIESFAAMPDKRLVVIGTGPDFPKLARDVPRNVTLMGFQEQRVLRDYMQRARAFVFAAKEDFGIVPVEAQACGTPVIAFGEGGAVETVRGIEDACPTGVLFLEQSVSSLVHAVTTFEANRRKLTPANCRTNAERFSNEAFALLFGSQLEKAIAAWKGRQPAQNVIG